jgi:hypothetical protein
VNRRSLVTMTVARATAIAAGLGRSESAIQAGLQSERSGDVDSFEAHRQKLDNAIRGWWDGVLARADEEAIRKDAEPRSPHDHWSHSSPKTLLFFPFPYTTGGGRSRRFPRFTDTSFSNLAPLQHDRSDIVGWNILD